VFKAVIFDFDGVIADTMKDNFAAWNQAFSAYNVQLNPLDYFLLEGMGRFQVAEFLLRKYGLDAGLEKQIVEAKEENYLLKNKFSVYPEINSIFTFLNNKKIPIAMATGASRERVEKTLKEDFLKQIHVLVTVDEVKKGKPDPESYYQATKKLKLKTEECLVIENAPLGIQSAKAAGCTCFAIETTLDKKYLKEADETFVNHLVLHSKLRKLFN
jgi:beta-phosphoglucomutase